MDGLANGRTDGWMEGGKRTKVEETNEHTSEWISERMGGRLIFLTPLTALNAVLTSSGATLGFHLTLPEYNESGKQGQLSKSSEFIYIITHKEKHNR